MSSPLADLVISQAQAHGLAFFKTVKPNDVGVTGGHQKGFHLSLRVANLFSPQEPRDGINHDHPITIAWTDGTVTNSVVKWYGKRSRHEYRITGFNRIRGFRYIHADRLGGVLVLIQKAEDLWLGHVLDDADDVTDVLSALGLSLDDSAWAIFTREGTTWRSDATASECENDKIREYANAVTQFPSTKGMAEVAREIVTTCASAVGEARDGLLVHQLRVEYDLFKAIENRLVGSLIDSGFPSVDEFLGVAQSVLQRRKARAGKSLELHFQDLLTRSGIPFEAQPTLDGTRPDFVVPSANSYEALEKGEPTNVMVVSAKTTCKDRWRQVLAEGPRVPTKFLVTLQQGISQNQMHEIRQSGVRLVVPKEFHDAFAPSDRGDLLTIEEFIAMAASVA